MRAMTVLGPIPDHQLGTTLIHEHVLFDFGDYWQTPTAATERALADAPITLDTLGRLRYAPFLQRDNLIHGDEDLAAVELMHFRARGGSTLVDATNASLGRDPRALQRIARRTGLNIVMGAGYYTDISLDDAFARRSVEDIAREIAHDVTAGVGETAVRAGMIGEIGTSAPITPNEARSLRASAQAQASTGAPLMVHLDGWAREGHHVLDIVEEEGGDPKRTILCHMNPSWHDTTYQTELASRGAYVEYDMMGMTYFYPPNKYSPDDPSAVRGIQALIGAGHTDRVLMSHDVFLKSMLRSYGGLGYTHLFDNLTPLFSESGIDEATLNAILTDNPRRVLAYLEERAT